MTLAKSLWNKMLVWTIPPLIKLRAKGGLLDEKHSVTWEKKKISTGIVKKETFVDWKGKNCLNSVSQDPFNSTPRSPLFSKGCPSLVISSTMFLSHNPILTCRFFSNYVGVISSLCSKAWGGKGPWVRKEVGEEQDCSEKYNFMKQFHFHEGKYLSLVHKCVLSH